MVEIRRKCVSFLASAARVSIAAAGLGGIVVHHHVRAELRSAPGVTLADVRDRIGGELAEVVRGIPGEIGRMYAEATRVHVS